MADVEYGNKQYWLMFKKWIAGEPNDDGEVRGFCPFHEDRHPSAHWNVQMQLFHCKTCDARNNFQGIAKAIKEGEVREPTDEDLENARLEIRKAVESASPKVPLTEKMIDEWHGNLLNNSARFHWLITQRGINPDIIEQFKIGWAPSPSGTGGRYILPIRDEQGNVVNVRRYDKESSHTKMISWPGNGSPIRLFPVENLLNNDRILVVEGEWDALTASQYDVPAVSGTGGAHVFAEQFLHLFAGKDVVVMYDNDDAGRQGAKNVAKLLQPIADRVSVATVPGPEGADVSDLFNIEGYSKQGLIDLMDQAAVHTRREDQVPEVADVPILSVEESFDPALVGKEFQVRGQAIAVREDPFLTPARLEAECTQDKGKICAACPMKTKWNGSGFKDIPKEHEFHRKFLLRDGRETEKKHFLQILGIPSNCDIVQVERAEEYGGEIVMVQGVGDDSSGNNRQRTIWNLRPEGTQPGSVNVFTGTSFPHPKTNANLMFTWESQLEGMDMDRFELDEQTAKLLRRFQHGPEQSPLDKMYEIAEDNAANVTRVHGRTDLHVAFDLVMHSALRFKFKGDYLKGRLDAAVIGDTRTGKSRAVEKLIAHYGAGKKINGEALSFAGLVGGVVTSKGGNYLEWGEFPLNHRRMLAVDEASGLVGRGKDARNIFSDITGIRESGLAQIHKIAKGEIPAELRLFWMMNAGENSSGVGVHDFKELIGRPEDVARFDFVLGLAGYEVPQEVIDSMPVVPQVYTAQACHALVMWVWSRKPDQIIFTQEAHEAAIKSSILATRYTEKIPLVQRANISEKVARIAVAIAARTFSTDKDMEVILVHEEHVDDAVAFLDSIYKKESFGYRAYSESVGKTEEVAEDKIEWLVRALEGKPTVRRYLQDNSQIIDPNSKIFLMAHGGFDVTKLYEYGFVERIDNAHGGEKYRKTAALHNALKRGS